MKSILIMTKRKKTSGMKGEYKNQGVRMLTTVHGSNYGCRYDWAAHIMPKDEDDSYWISSPTEAKLLKRVKKELENYK